MKKILLTGLAIALVSMAGVVNAALIGPSPYLEFADSPFSGGTFDYFHLENFEDGNFNTPGVNSNAGVTYTNGINGDSVDGDDGNPSNGVCSGCYSFYAADAQAGITFTFDKLILGSLPTSVGIVWTDSRNDITFEAFDSGGASLGTLAGTHADGVFTGTTAEDRFYGVENAGGISSIFISAGSIGGGGLEVDHLQYGVSTVPIPAAAWLFGSGLLGLFGFSKRKKAIA